MTASGVTPFLLFVVISIPPFHFLVFYHYTIFYLIPNQVLLHLIIRGGFLHFEHLVLFLCYQKEIRGINFIPQSVESFKNYINECSEMLLKGIKRI